MSRAFIKEDLGEGLEDLPDRAISPYPNFVTQKGLAAIEEKLTKLNSAYGVAQSTGDRILLQRLSRELRYWTHRRQTAMVQSDPTDKSSIQFGSLFRLLRDDGQEIQYRIVGEDEANPKDGTLSFVAPLARALMGKCPGESVFIGEKEFRILALL